jgi:serine/threonine protein kinase
VARTSGISGFEKIVALKRILPQYAAQDDFVQMFLDEARLTATIQHNNVAQVYDIGSCDDGLCFTREYVHGADLRTVLHALARAERRMPLAHALTVAIGAAAGLHAAHERTTGDGRPLGIIHRDITPSNVLVSFDGCVKLIDFGIAKSERRSTETQAGTLKGKIAYMSPEQCQGEALDRRSDVFSLGIVLFEATTGTRLFASDNEYAALRQIVDQDAPRPSSRVADYPPALEEIVLRALRRDREARYPSALALQMDLEELARSRGMATSTALLATWMRELLPERAAEPLIDDRLTPPPLALPLPPRGTGRNSAIVDDAVPNLADELEPSISIQAPSAVGPEPTSAALSSVSKQLAMLHRQRRMHFLVAIGLAAAIAAASAVTLLVLMKGDGGDAAPAAVAPVQPPPPPPQPPPAVADVAPVPAPMPVVIEDPEPPPPPRAEPRKKRSSKPRPPRSKPARWNSDSALPPM